MMIPCTVREVAAAVGGKLLQGGEDITRVSTDSRDILPGDLFVPLVGERFDGHAYIDMALQKGASGCLCAQIPENLQSDKFYIAVDDTEKALGSLAGWYRGKFDIPVVQVTGSAGSGMAMDKAITKRFMDAEGIRTAPWHDVHYTQADIPALVEKLEVPCAVKIVNGGSSLGVELPDTKEQLADTLHRMLKYGDHVVVEKKIKGREIQIAVLGDDYLPAVEIIPKNAYFDYESKYQKGGAVEICPAPITEEEWQQVGQAALKLHRALGLSVYSRTDFILDEEGRAWCLEVNTLPGMTPTSLVPQEAAAVGMDYDSLCEKIAEESLRVRKAERI